MNSSKRLKTQQQAQEKQAVEAEHCDNIRSAFDDGGKPSKECLETLTETPLDAATLRHLRNLLSKEFVLGNLNAAEKDELKWLFRTVALRVVSMHPPESLRARGIPEVPS